MRTVVTNSTVDGILAAFFALLVVIIILNAAVVCWRATRSTEPLPSTEAPYVKSRLLVPAGRVSTEDAGETADAGAPADRP